MAAVVVPKGGAEVAPGRRSVASASASLAPAPAPAAVRRQERWAGVAGRPARSASSPAPARFGRRVGAPASSGSGVARGGRAVAPRHVVVSPARPAGPRSAPRPGAHIAPAERHVGVASSPRARRRVPASVYRRRRIVAGLVLAAVLAAVAIAVAGLLADRPLTVVERRAPAGAEHAPLQLDARPVSRRVHVVQPGETVWSIARSVGSEGDVRPVVDALMAQLGGRAAQPGDRLVLP